MRETEIEVEETEVERVYCDRCGDECTDDHRVEPREVCPSCADETAVERVVDLLTPEPESDEEPGWLEVAFFTAIYPLVFLLILTLAPGDDEGPDSHEIKLMLFFTGGGVLWTAILLVLLL